MRPRAFQLVGLKKKKRKEAELNIIKPIGGNIVDI